MLSSSLDTLLKLSKTTNPQKLFANDCVTLYISWVFYTTKAWAVPPWFVLIPVNLI